MTHVPDYRLEQEIEGAADPVTLETVDAALQPHLQPPGYHVSKHLLIRSLSRRMRGAQTS